MMVSAAIYSLFDEVFHLCASSDEYFDDLGIAYRAEIKELYDIGCREAFLSTRFVVQEAQCLK